MIMDENSTRRTIRLLRVDDINRNVAIRSGLVAKRFCRVAQKACKGEAIHIDKDL